jgi:fibro-slime domain-containing protein
VSSCSAGQPDGDGLDDAAGVDGPLAECSAWICAQPGHKYHFTYQAQGFFDYKPGTGQTFSFTGDDDVWLFFDKKLGIDLGGVHGADTRSVNLDNHFGPGKAEGTYALDFFFAERHTTDSTLVIETSLLPVSPPVIPEPSTYALLLGGLGMLGWVVRRGARKTADGGKALP